MPRQILTSLFPEHEPPAETAAPPSSIASVVRKVLGKGSTPIAVQGQDGLLVYLAKCCNPIPGDDIVGYITRGKGISVHKADCSNVPNFTGDRIAEVAWINVQENEVFPVRLAIDMDDRQGILADITSAISNLKTNIRESRSSSDGGHGSVELTIDISDLKHLQKVVQVLKSIRGIRDVERIGGL